MSISTPSPAQSTRETPTPRAALLSRFPDRRVQQFLDLFSLPAYFPTPAANLRGVQIHAVLVLSYSGSAVTKARPEDVWAAWVDVSRWSAGNVIEMARLNGEFVEGSKIVSKAKGFPKSTLTITRVEPPRLWVNESRTAGTRMTFEHLIEPQDVGARITERVLIREPMSRLVGRVMRRRLEALFAATTDQVARQAESD